MDINELKQVILILLIAGIVISVIILMFFKGSFSNFVFSVPNAFIKTTSQ